MKPAFRNSTPLFLTILLVSLAACQATERENGGSVTVTPAIPTASSSPNLLNPAAITATYLANNIRVATVTGSARATIMALTPTRTRAPTRVPATSTPTISPTQYFAWALFQNNDLGVSFEYPLWFDLKPFSDYGCQPDSGDVWDRVFIDVGERIWISRQVFDQSKVSLSQYADQQKDTYEADGTIIIENVNWGYVGDVRAVTIEYRFGALNRYGIETHFARNNVLYTAVFSAGGTCDFINPIEPRISEFEAYWHLLHTWRFLD